MDLYKRLAQIQNSRHEMTQSLENHERGITIGGRLLQRYPGDNEVGRRLAQHYVANAIGLRALERRQEALDSSLRAIGVIREMLPRHPEDRELRAELAVAMSGAATSQARMNRLEEARRNLRDVVAQWDFLHQQEPTNNQFQRNRMLAYSHLGDLLGNPNYTNAGDTSGAMAAFRSMLSIAESLHRANPGDQAATIDYGMALARVATLPFGEVAERLAMYEKAAGLLEQARGRDRGNATLQINLAAQKEQTGDLLATAAKITEALEAYRAGLALAQGFTRPAGQRIALTISEKLASLLAKRGDVREALAHAARAVSVGEAAAADPSAVLATRVLKPRGYAAMGSVQTLLGKTAAARRWYERALKEFRLLEKDPAFTPAHRQFMHQVQEALRKR
jgi:tetratricopeptide (TPR) repeat protein